MAPLSALLYKRNFTTDTTKGCESMLDIHFDHWGCLMFAQFKSSPLFPLYCTFYLPVDTSWKYISFTLPTSFKSLSPHSNNTLVTFFFLSKVFNRSTLAWLDFWNGHHQRWRWNRQASDLFLLRLLLLFQQLQIEQCLKS